MKKMLSFVFAMVMVLAFTGCGETEPTNAEESVNQKTISPTQACSYLDKIYIAGVENVPSPSCGITLPQDMPMEYFEMEATAVSRDGNETVDLLEDKEITPGEWIVFEDLSNYSEATCIMRIKGDTQVFAEKEIDLLNFQDGFLSGENQDKSANKG